MRKLGKKNHEIIETIEAYCSCYAKKNCWRTCGDDYSVFKGVNDSTYNIVYHERNSATD